MSRNSGLALTLAVVLLLPWLLPNNFMLDIAVRIALTSIAVIGLNFLMGFAGQISIGHAAFVAMGAYGSGILISRWDWPVIPAALVVCLVVSALAWLIAKPFLRLKGHSLTMATLGMGVIVNMVLINEVNWTGGPDGMPVPPLVIGSFAVTKIIHWYALAAACLWLCCLLSVNLFDSPAGRALRGLHGSEIAARVVGVDVSAFKVRAFVCASAFAAFSGVLSGHYLGFISPALSSFTHSVELTTMVVLGGMSSTYGVVLGAALLTILPQLVGGLNGYEAVLFGLVLMLTMIFLPRGILPSLVLLLKRA